MKCEKCNAEITGSHCSDCGRPTNMERIGKRYFAMEIGGLLFFEKGIFYTIRELIVKPGKSVKEYLFEDRTRLMKPLTYLFLMAFINSIFEKFLKIAPAKNIFGASDSGYSGINSYFHLVNEWCSQNYGYFTLIAGFFWSYWIYLFFKKHKYNFYEIAILICYVLSTTFLFLYFSDIGASLGMPAWVGTMISYISLIYCIWAIVQFFGGKVKYYIKTVLALIFGIFSLYFIVFFVGVIVEILMV